MKTQPQSAAKSALPAVKKLPNKLPIPRVTPKKSKGTLAKLPIIQYAKRKGKKVQIGV